MIQNIKKLILLEEFVSDLCACAAEPTEAKINEFYGKYDEKRQDIQAAIPVQTWGDKKIFADGEAILAKIGVGAPLDEVREDLKKAAVDHFMADFRACVEDPSTTKIADLYNDYSNKFVHIAKIINNPLIIDAVNAIFNMITDYNKLYETETHEINTVSSRRNFQIMRLSIKNNSTYRPLFTGEQTVNNIHADVKFLVFLAAAEQPNEKAKFMTMAADAFVEACSAQCNKKEKKRRYNTIFLPYYDMIKPYFSTEQVAEMEKFSIKQTQINEDVANTSTQAETPEVEKPGSFTEMVDASRSNESLGGCRIM